LELCRFDDLADGEARGYSVPGLGRKVVLVRKGGAIFGYLDSCPHYAGGTPMAWKTDAYLDGEGAHIACHSHGALFDIETGDCVLGPCLGQSLTRVPVSISSNGGIDAVVEGYLEEVA
jgi:nitrite reductase/ring-hydroxylating ferredoxin subunit